VATDFSNTNKIGVYVHDVNAVVSAFTERFFFIHVEGQYREPLQPVANCFQQPGYRIFRDQVLHFLPSNFPRMGRQQTVDCYSGLKRKRYQDAFISLQRETLAERDSEIKLFCKFAKVEIGSPARIISPRSPRWNLELARYVKHLEHKIYRSIHKTFLSQTSCTVMKGLDVDETARVLKDKFDRFYKPVALMLDVSKLDASTRVPHLKYEHTFYRGVYPWSRHLKWMLKCMRKHRCVAYCPDGVVRVKTAGRRASGDVTTSLGNVILVMGILYQLFLEFPEIELANNGDDCILFVEQTNLNLIRRRVVDLFYDAGMHLKVDGVATEFEQIVFCQHQPICVSGAWRMVRQPTTVVSKDSICLLHCHSEKTYRKWLGAVACAGLHLCDGVPVLQAFYDVYKRSGRDPGDRLFDTLMRHTHFIKRRARRDSKIEDTTRVSFYLATGILPDAQLEIEKWLSSLRIDQLSDNVIEQCMLLVNQGDQLRLLHCKNDEV